VGATPWRFKSSPRHHELQPLNEDHVDAQGGPAARSTVIRKLVLLTIYAIGMAQVEAALVVHLRSIYYPDDPLTLFPLVFLSQRDLLIELTRECATIAMIASVALLSSRTWIRAFAVFVYVFGVWDLGYYAWLKTMLGWPTRWLEWDILFLIPWPWLGPWIAPALVAALFVAWGARVLSAPGDPRFTGAALTAFLAGSSIVLAAFLLPGLPLLTAAPTESGHFEPEAFRWWLFFPGYLLMVGGLVMARSDPVGASERTQRY
jgi:hypothetical protein